MSKRCKLLLKNRVLLRSFTLLELLVAVALLTLIVVLLFQVISQALVITQRVETEKSFQMTARQSRDLILKDLRASLFPWNTPGTSSRVRFEIITSGLNGYQNSQCAFWQVFAPGTASKGGQIVDVGYFVEWLTDTTPPRAQLCRVFINQSDPNSISSNPNRVWSAELLRSYAPGLHNTTAGDSSAYNGLVGENVIGLWIRLKTKNGVLFPVSVDSRSTNSWPGLPASAVIGMVLLENNAARRLDSATLSRLTALYANSVDTSSFMNAASNAVPNLINYCHIFEFHAPLCESQ